MRSLIDTSIYCMYVYISFIQITGHLIKTSNIQTWFRTASYMNPKSSVVAASLRLVSHKVCQLELYSYPKKSIVWFKYFIPTQKTDRKLEYLHKEFKQPMWRERDSRHRRWLSSFLRKLPTDAHSTPRPGAPGATRGRHKETRGATRGEEPHHQWYVMHFTIKLIIVIKIMTINRMI